MQPVVGVWESIVSHRRQTPAERGDPTLIISADKEKGETLQLLMDILQSRSGMYENSRQIELTSYSNAELQKLKPAVSFEEETSKFNK